MGVLGLLTKAFMAAQQRTKHQIAPTLYSQSESVVSQIAYVLGADPVSARLCLCLCPAQNLSLSLVRKRHRFIHQMRSRITLISKLLSEKNDSFA